MSKKFKVIVNTGKEQASETLEVTQGQGGRGKPLRIKAKEGVKYQLQEADKGNGVGPDTVKVKRVGKHLHILFEGSEEADVIIENYYSVMPEGYNGVVGLAEDGNFYEYIPEDPDFKGLIPQLDDGGNAVSVALGGAEVVGSGAAIGILAFNPLLAALGLAGAGAAAAAAAAGGGTASGDVAITAVADNVGNPENGSVNLSAGGLTNDNTPTLTGRAPAGAVVTIRDGDAVLGTTTADATGAWSFTPAALAEGNHSFTATANVGGSPVTSGAFAIVIDTVTPTIAVSVPKTSLANGEAVTVTFTLSDASTDFALADVSAVGGTLSNFQGSGTGGTSYSATFTPNAGVTSAMVFVDSDKFRDAAGNLNKDGGEPDNTVSFSVGTGTGTNNALGLTSVTDNAANTPEGAAINIAAGGLTNDNTPTVNGTAPAGSVVTIRDGTTVLGTASTNAQGVWSFTPTALPEGARSLSASTTVNGVTTNAGPFAFTVDTTPPTIAVSVDKNNLANGETATLTFTLSEPSADFQVSDITSLGGAISNLQGVPGTGNANTGFTQYTATFTPNASATSAAIVVSSDRFSDAAGNLNKDGADTNNAVSLAISPANGLISIDSASDNVGNPGNVDQPIANGGQTNDTTHTLTGKAPAGSVVTVRDGAGVLGTTTANANGTWSFTPAARTEGAHTFVASFVANGVTNTSNAYSLTVDTTAPTIQITADKAALLNAGETATVFFDLSEPSTDLSNADIALSRGTLSTLLGVPGTGNAASGFTRYAATFTKTAASGTASVSVASDRFSDAAGNFNQDGADTNNTWTFSGTATTATTIGAVTDNVGNPGNAVQPITNGGQTNDNTPTFNGRGTPGETVTIKDGDTVVGTALVNPDGTWSFTSPTQTEGPHSYTASTPSGGTSAPFTFTVDTTAPKIAVTIDKTALSSDATAVVTFTLSEASTDFVQGDIKVTGGSIGPLTQSSTNPRVYTATFTPDNVTSSTPVTASIQVESDKFSDAAGNFNKDGAEADNSVSVSVSAGQGNAAITLDPITGDNVITVAEGNATSITLTGKVTGAFTAGDVVTLSLNGKTQTAAVAANGTYSFSASSADLKADSDTKAEVSVVATSQGKSVTATNSQDYTVETSNNTGTALVIDPVTADNIINASESGATNTAITGKVNGVFQAGNVVTLTVNGKNVTGSVNAQGGFSINVPTADLIADPDTQVEGSVTIGSGQSFAASQNYAVDTSAPTATVTLNPLTADNKIDAAEAGQVSLPVTGKVEGEVKAGDVVTVTVNGKPFTAAVQANGTFSVNVPTADLIADPDTKYEVTVALTDGAGNTGTATASNDYSSDVPPPAQKAAIILDPVTGDNVITVTEGNAMSITLTGKVTGAFTAGDVVTLSLNGKTFTAAAAANGNYSFSAASADLKADADTKVEVSVAAKDPITGTIVNASNSQDYTVETTDNTGTALTIDPVTADNIINAAEAGAANRAITGKVTGVVAAGERVTLTINGKTFTGATAADGSYSISVPTADLIADPDTQIEGSVTTAGGLSFTASQNYAIDTTAPTATVTLNPLTANNKIEAAEAGQTSLPVTGKVEGEFKAGDVVTVTVNGKPFTAAVQANGNFSVNVPTADLIADPDTKYEVSVALTDGAGNPGTATASNDYDSDVTPPANNVAISLNPVTGDNIVSVADGQATSITLSGKVSGAFSAGDVVTLGLNGKSFTTAVAADGSYSFNTSTADIKADLDTKVEVSVAAKDPANGKTNTVFASQDYTVETNDTTGQTVALFLDTVTADNVINAAEALQAETSITGRVTGKFATGDTVSLSINGKTFTAAATANGSFSVNVPTADLVADSDTQIEATVTTSAGTATAFQNYATTATTDTTATTITGVTDNVGNPGNSVDPITNGGQTNDTTPTLSGKAPAGEAVVIRNGDQIIGTTTADAQGNWSFTPSALPQGPYSLTASTSSGGTSAPFTFTIDTTAPKIAVTIDKTTLSSDETAVVTFTLTEASTDFVRDDIKVIGGIIGPLTQSSTNPRVYTAVFTPNAVTGGAVVAASIQVESDKFSDAAGNLNTDGAEADNTASLSVSAGKGNAAVILNPIAGDNIISVAEGNAATIAVTGRVTGAFTTGDVVTLSVNGKPFTGTATSNGSYSIPVSSADLKADPDTKLEVSVAATFKGSTVIATNSQDYSVETSNGTGTALSIDPVTADNILNTAESATSTTAITGKVTGVFQQNNTVTLTVNGKPFTGSVNAQGGFSISVATADLLSDADTQVDGSVTIGSGLSFEASQNYAVDTTAPTAIVTLNPLTPDNNLDTTEASQNNLPVTGKVEGEVKAGDVVTVTVNGKPFTTTVKSDGTFSVNVPTTDLAADPDTKYEVSVALLDASGNPGTAFASNDYTSSAVLPANNVAISLNPVTGDNVVSLAEGQAATVTLSGQVTGAFTAGDVVTLTLNGKTATASTDATGAYSFTVSTADLRADPDTKAEVSVAAKNPADGKTNTVSTSQDYTVETDATAGQTVALFINTVTADNVINAAEAQQADTAITGQVTGKFATGDVVTLSINNKTLTGAAAANGSFSIPVPTADLVADFDTQIDGRVTTSAGTALAVQNYAISTNPDVTPPNDGKAVALTIDTDTNNDGFINRAELSGSATVSVSAGFDGSLVAVGDVLSITDGSTIKNIAIDAAAKAAGKVTTTFAAPAEGSSITVSAVLRDAANNATPEARDTARRDTSNFGPVDPNVDPANADKNVTIQITSDADNNAVLNVTELTSGRINVRVGLSADARAGDTLVVEGSGNAAQTITLSAEQIAAKEVRVQFTPPANGTNFVASAQLSDIAKNTSPKVTDTATVNTSLPGSPTVVIEEDANNDGFINRTELNGEIGVKATPPSTAVAGDTLTITDGTTVKTFVLTSAQLTDGVTITFAAPADGGTFSVSSTLTVAATGNVSNPGTDSARLDLTDFSTVDPTNPNGPRISAVRVNIDTDVNNDGQISVAELSGTSDRVKVTVLLPTGVGTAAAVGDTLTIKASGNADRVITLTAAHINAGQVVITDYTSTGDNTTFNVTASIRDAASNASPTPDASDSATIRSTIAGAPVVTITEDTNNDGFINASELQGTLGVNISIPTAAKAGDTLRVTVGTVVENITLTAANITAGSITREITAPANGSTLSVQAQLIDQANNASAVGSDSAVIDTTLPNGGNALALTIDTDANNDGFINRGELNGSATVSVSAAFTGSSVAVGDVVTITDGTTIRTITINDAAKTAGKVTTTFAAPAEGASITVRATLKDAANNATPEATDTARRDTSNFGPVDPVIDPNNADKNVTIQITSDTDNNAVLNTSELTSGRINVRVGLSADARAGDTLVVEGTGNAAQTITLSAAQITAREVLVQFTPPANGTNFVAAAQLSDVAKNTSARVTDNATINTSLPGSPTVVIEEDANNDGFINRSELNGEINVKATPPSTAVAGDTLTITDGTTVKTFVLTAAQLTSVVTTTFAAPADGGTFSVSSTLTVVATGNVSNPGTDSARLDLTDFSTVDPTNPNGPRISAVRVNIDTDANNDGQISVAELTGTSNNVKVTVLLPTGTGTAAVAGDTLTVKASGNSDRTITLTAAHISAGEVVITDYTSTGDNTTFNVTASIRDAANNASPTPDASDSATIRSTIAGAPVVTITEDGNNDGFINTAELSGTVGVNISIPTAAKAGDTLRVTVGTVVENITLTTANITAGSVTREITAPANGSTLSVQAQLIDQANNASAVGSDSAVIDTTLPNGGNALALTIDTDGNNDGFINRIELNGSPTVTVSAAFTGSSVAVGDVVTITDGTTSKNITIDAAAKTANKVTTTFTAPAEGASITVKATLRDAANNATPEASDTAQRDTTDPTNASVALALRITTDNAPDNGVVSPTELNGATSFTSRASFNSSAKAGDKIVFDATNGTTTLTPITHTLTAADIANTFVEVSFANPAEGQTQTVTAHYVDAAGNPATDGSVSDNARLDTTAPAQTVTISAIKDDVGDFKGTVNSGETTDDTQLDLEGTISAALAAGEVVQVFDGDDLLGTAVVNGTNWTFADPRTLTNNQTVQYTAKVLDAANLSGPVSSAYSATIVTSLPSITVTSVAGNAVNDTDTLNGLYDATERGTTADPAPVISGTTSNVQAGRVVTATINIGGVDKSYTGTVQNDGTWSVSISSADALTLNHGNTFAITAQVSNTAGNKASDTNNGVRVDIQPADIPTVNNLNSGTLTPTLTGQALKETAPSSNSFVTLATGDTISVTVGGATYTGTLDTTATNNGLPTGLSYNTTTNQWSLNTATATPTSGTLSLSNGTPNNVAVSVTAGGVTKDDESSGELVINTTAPTITLAEISTDGFINAAESGQPLVISGTTTAQVGSIVTITGLDTITRTATVLAGTGGTNTFTLTIPATEVTALANANGTKTATASVVNAFGLSANDTEDVVIDIVSPTAVADTASANEDLTTLTGNVGTNDTNKDSTEAYSLSGSATGSFGSLVLGSNGAWTYTVDEAKRDELNAITANAVETFSYKVTDAAGNSTSSTLAITLTPVNDAPVNTVPGTQTTAEDTAKVITGLSIADVDAGGSAVTVTLAVTNGSITAATSTGVTITNNGTASVTLSGTVSAINTLLGLASGVTYTPTAHFNGSATLTLTTNDGGNTGSGGAQSDVDTVTINVTAVNDAPVGVNDTATIGEAGGANNGTPGSALTSTTSGVSALNVLANDTDVDAGDTLSVKDIKAGTGGAVTAVAAGSTSTSSGTAIAGSFGTLTIGANGSYTYVVDQGNATVQALNTTSTALSDEFTYTVQDAAGLTSTATITVSVTGANDAPTVANALVDQSASASSAFSYQFAENSFADVDNASLTYTFTVVDSGGTLLATQPSWLSLDASTRTFSGTPTSSDTGLVRVRVTASDGSLSVSDIFDINVINPNVAPVADPTMVNSLAQQSVPTVTITDNRPGNATVAGQTVTYTLKFSEPIDEASLTADDIVVTNGGTKGALTRINASEYTISVEAPSGNGVTTLRIADGSYTSANGVSGMGATATQAFGSEVPSSNLTGTTGVDNLAGGDTADTITANGGADTIFAGAGNDTVIINSNNIAALAATNTMFIDGGSGVNTLRIDGAGQLLDLTNATVASKLDNFSVIDITGSGNNGLRLDWASVNAITGGANVANTAVNEAKLLVVNGNTSDFVELANLSQWTVGAAEAGATLAAQLGSQYGFTAGQSYKAYTLNGVTVYVNTAMGDATNASSTSAPAQLLSQAQTVQTLFGPSFTDSDGNTVAKGQFKGVVITDAGDTNDQSTMGVYQWSTDGTNWTSLAAGLSDSSSVFLAPTTLIRFQAAAGVASLNQHELKARLVDNSGETGTGSLTNGATAVNASDNGGATAFSGNVITLKDTVSQTPVIVSLFDNVGSTTGNFASGVSTDDNTPTLSGTAEAGATIKLFNGTTEIGTTTANGAGVWSFTPTTAQASGSYSITAQAVDAANNNSATSNTFTYTLEADTTAPTLVSTSPADNSTVAFANLGNNLTLTFSEAVKAGTGVIELVNANNTVVESFNVATSTRITGWNTDTITIDPTADLAGGTGYFVRVATTAVQDLAGNAFAGITNNTTFNFTTLNADGSLTPAATATLGGDISGLGDVNGDGFDDFSIGGATIVFGSAEELSGLTAANLADGSGKGAVINLNFANQPFRASAGGDFNGDGINDIAVATAGAFSGSRVNVVFGKVGLANLNVSSLGSTGGFVINMESPTTTATTAISLSTAGDVNGDGLTDLLLTNYTNPVNAGTGAGAVGRAYVIYGKTDTGTIDLNNLNSTSGFSVKGGTRNTSIPIANAGDVNGDGLSDIIQGESVNAGTGFAYVRFGSTAGASPSSGFTIRGGTAGGFDDAGVTVAGAGDVNGDGLADLLIGASSGRSYVVFGKTSTTQFELSNLVSALPEGGFAILGSSSSPDSSGRSSSYAGDLNGDGLADLLVASGAADPAGKTDAGKVYVVYGKTDTTAINLTSLVAGNGGFVISGESANDRLGGNNPSNNFVTNAGDLNGDGFDDLVVSSLFKTYVIYGGSQAISGAVALGTGTSASEYVVGTSGNDTLSGGGGIDRFSAGKGNDTIVLQASDAANLANNTAGGLKAMVDGGTGYDTLQLSASGVNLDLTAISAVGGASGEGQSRVNSIERINLGADSTANTLALTALDVNDLSTFNLIRVGTMSEDGKFWTNVSGRALDATTRFKQLVVEGTSADALTLEGSFALVGVVNNGSADYNVYQSTLTRSQVIASTAIKTEVVFQVNLSEVDAGRGGFAIEGQGVDDRMGYNVANAGDVNGDGYDDFIVSSPFADVGIKLDAGRSYVVFGKSGGPSGNTNIKLSSVANGVGGFVINGADGSDFTGHTASAAGDVNGDGLADIIVASPGADLVAGDNNGRAFVVYGKTSGTAVNLPLASSSLGFSINSQGSSSITFVSDVGDVNGDGLSDLIVSNANSDVGNTDDAGKAFVVFGRTGNNTAISLSAIEAGSGGFVINGAVFDERAGTSARNLGDFNGDGFADVIVGADFSGDINATGQSYVVFGKSSTSAVNLSNPGAAAFKIVGESAGDRAFRVSAAGDVNGDGLADLVVGAAGVDGTLGSDIGRSYVVFGKTGAQSTVQLSAIAAGLGGFAINGEAAGDLLGTVAYAGDINGDGLADLIVSASGSDKGNGIDSGRAYVVYGKTGTSAINLTALERSVGGFVINGQSAGDAVSSVSYGGDINGDGYDDLLVGATGADPAGINSAGKAYVIFGSKQFDSSQVGSKVDFVGDASANMLTGTAAAETFAAGDGNDLLIGNGGADVMQGGRGNDTLVINASNITALSSVMGAGGNITKLARLDGGTGYDTLRLSDGAALDLTAVSNVSAMSTDNSSRISSIERIDLATDTAGNTLTLTSRDVNDMAGFNAIRLGASDDGKTWTKVSGGTSLTVTTKFHQLVVDGTSADTLILEADKGAWGIVGEVSDGTNVYSVYQNTDTTSQVIVDKDVVVVNNDSDPFVAPLLPDTLDLGTVSGQRLNLVAKAIGASGKVYYHIDDNGDGLADRFDYVTHEDLDKLFNGGADTTGASNPTAGQDTERSVIVNGYTLVLPTRAEISAELENGRGWFEAYGWPTTAMPYWTADLASTGNHFQVSANNLITYSSRVDNFSLLAFVEVKVPVAPVVLDLNRDGFMSYGQVTMDVNGDRILDTTRWAGAQDGVLVWDKFADGLVHDNSQYAFGQYATTFSVDAQGFARLASDLEGLADGFDTNRDGVFDTVDEKFAEFSVWQDANQNGVSDAGEVSSLADWGIASINLVSDGVQRNPVDGVFEAGRSTATTTDGQTILVADAAFAFRDATADELAAAIASSVNASLTKVYSLQEGQSLELGALLGETGSQGAPQSLNVVDMASDSAANVVSLSLSDVLSLPSANGLHQLMLTGAANDTLMLREGEWADTGEVVSQNGHNFAVYSGSNDATAQLLIDQQMVSNLQHN